MRTKHVPLFAVVLTALISVITIVPGVISGKKGATVEAMALGKSNSPAIDEVLTKAEVEETVANCRYGVATTKNSTQYQLVDDFGAGWWLNFQANYTEPAANGAEFVHLIWVQQDKDGNGDYLNSYQVTPPMDDHGLGYLLLSRPGHMWLVGNEVDRGPDPGSTVSVQGDTMPELYAEIYHDVYHYIKEWDPTALVAPSALIEFTPGRAQYLDKVWNRYKALYRETLPVDFWNTHLYILPEKELWSGKANNIASIALGTDPLLARTDAGGNPANCALDDVYCLAEHDNMDVFAEQVVLMRQWMKDHGYQNYPLIISEYAILYKYEVQGDSCVVMDEYGNCFTPQRVAQFASNTFNYLSTETDPELGYPYDGGRLVQQWLWYGVYHTTDFAVSNLATSGLPPLNLTPAGQEFYNAARAEPATVNLLAVGTNNPRGSVEEGMVNAMLSLEIRNNGNTRVNQPINVTFYRDEALTKVIGSATVPAPDENFVGMTGCAVRGFDVTVTASWAEDLETGVYPYWAKVDSSNSVGEENEKDNVASGIVTVIPASLYIPMVVR